MHGCLVQVDFVGGEVSKNAEQMSLKLKEDLDRINWVSEQLSESPPRQSPSSSLSDVSKPSKTEKITQYLAKDILDIQEDMNQLISSLNSTEKRLKIEQERTKSATIGMEKHRVEEQANKIIGDIKDGKIAVDYETGKLQKKDNVDQDIKDVVGDQVEEDIEKWSKNITKEDGSFESKITKEGEVTEDADKSTLSLTQKEPLIDQEVVAEKLFAQQVANKVQEEIELLKMKADPAVMQVEVSLLLDIVTLAIAASLCGLLAVYCNLPSTAGFLFGGMIIGPSCFDLVDNVKEVQTLSQFGSVFLLFEQGLLYAQQYTKRQQIIADGESIERENPLLKSPNPSTEQRMSGNKLQIILRTDTRMAGAALFGSMMLLAGSALILLGSITKGYGELIIVSASIALTSSTVVSESLHAAHMKDSVWGSSVLKLVAIQDLIMIPLLAFPELYHNFIAEEEGFVLSYGGLAMHISIVAVFFVFSFVFGKYWIAVAYRADHKPGQSEGELFTLSCVAYTLMMATFTEENQISLEAGALFSGVALMRSEHVGKVLISIRPVTSVFGGMYVTSLGMIISPVFVNAKIFTILGLVAIIGASKWAIASYVVYQSFGYEKGVSIALSSSMAQISEGSLVVLAKAQHLGFVTRHTYLTLIPTTCLLLSLGPFSAGLMKGLKGQRTLNFDNRGNVKQELIVRNDESETRKVKRREIV